MAQVEIQINSEELKKRKIMICTPMYGGQCAGIYTKSCTDLSALARNYGVQIGFFYLFNESLITRARNYLVDEFMRSDFTHLMFIDSDIGFDPTDVLALAAIAEPGTDKDIVCGPYPKKAIAWEKIKRAVDKGFADENPSVLEKYVGDYVFNPVVGSGDIRIDQPAEVLEGGTGFMMIQRSAFERYAEAILNLCISQIIFVQLISMAHVRLWHTLIALLILKRSVICPKIICSVNGLVRQVLKYGCVHG